MAFHLVYRSPERKDEQSALSRRLTPLVVLILGLGSFRPPI